MEEGKLMQSMKSVSSLHDDMIGLRDSPSKKHIRMEKKWNTRIGMPISKYN
jgi:hypothetical protein